MWTSNIERAVGSSFPLADTKIVLLRNALSRGHNTCSSVKANNSTQNIDIPFRLQEMINLFDKHGSTVFVKRLVTLSFYTPANKLLEICIREFHVRPTSKRPYKSHGWWSWWWWWYVITGNNFIIYYNKFMQMKYKCTYIKPGKFW
jgi:hypothetical protein